MKNKILKILTIMLLLVSLTMTNFIYVGVGLVSYAASSTQTNHQNVEFGATLKDTNILELEISVKKEGYFNGTITLDNSNFKLKGANSNFIQKIEDNTITLNQINSGTTASMQVEIEPVKEDIFDAGLLNMVSKLTLTGTYKDSTEKNINIKATREVKLEYTENNENENVENTIEVITNKITKVSGEEKRVVQLSINMGLKDNNYPIREITSKINVPTIDGKQPTIVKKVGFNTMTHYDYQYSNAEIEMTFTNEPNNNNQILWKKQGNENVVLTLIYDKDVELDGLELQAEEKVTLYNEKTLSATNKIELNNEEKDQIVNVKANNTESLIYKGKLYSAIDREYESKTAIAINLANAEENLSVKEESTKYIVNDQEIDANVVYNKTTISKEKFDKILGENGTLTILNEKGETIASIDSKTEPDENGNIEISYQGKEPNSIEIKMSTPVAEGDLELVHTKTIKASSKDVIKSATKLSTKINYSYNTNVTKTVETQAELKETETKVQLEVNKETLSTVVENNVEIRAILKANSEQYNLYKNPTLVIELPEDVENIKINNIGLVYESELKLEDYKVEGRTITINLTGEQTSYKSTGIEGAIIVLNADIAVNKKSATKDSKIIMNCYNQETMANDEKAIKIVAPKDMTTINNIKELNIETIGQEETKTVELQRGTDSKQLETEIEVINNNENAVEKVKVMGTFPTENKENNIDIKVVEPISLQAVEGAKVYYTENEDATDDVNDAKNQWQETITNSQEVKKYLIELPSLEAQASIKANYKIEIPATLEYNKIAKEGYTVSYTNSLSKVENTIKATTISLETGVGPIAEVKLTSSVGNEETTTVKTGEVITYKVEVSNTGSEDLNNIEIEATVPDGATLVVPEENYEYTGASYYKELEDRIYKDTIESLAKGETITKEYEVRVDKQTTEGTLLSSKAQIKYGDVVKESNQEELKVETGKLQVTVKRITLKDIELYSYGTVRYYAIIENITDKKQNNVEVKTNLPEMFEVETVELATGMKSEEISDKDLYDMNDEGEETTEQEIGEQAEDDVKIEELDYSDKINIGSLEPGENKVLIYSIQIGKVDNAKKVDFSVAATLGKEEYKSNSIAEEIKDIDVTLKLESNTQSKYLKSGDVVEYTITAKNETQSPIYGLNIKDTIPAQMTIQKVTLDGEIVEGIYGNDVEISCDIAAGASSNIKIEAIVDYSESRTQAETIVNVVTAELAGEEIAKTAQISHIIEANDGQNNASEDNNVKDSDIANGNKMITGLAWFDENANGKKDENEKTLSGVKVNLLNTQTNNLVKDEKGKTLEAVTDENGLYVLNNIGNGRYIVVFKYDDTIYTLTKYQAQGVEETLNSKVMKKELLIGDQKQEVASTDIIELNQNNIEDINIGLTKLQNFDLQLEKFVSKILIQNSAGTTVKEYNNETLAKAELDSKKINGTSVVIEYKIKVTNIGEVDGYAKKIVDYIPSDLKFSSELNKDWYQTGDSLYNVSLANDKIAAGESKTLTLTLTKAMTEANTGRTNNTAEIAEDYNELGLKDTNSTPANRKQGENDMSSADVILSIKTGGAIYITITIVTVILLIGIGYIIFKKKFNKKEI